MSAKLGQASHEIRLLPMTLILMSIDTNEKVGGDAGDGAKEKGREGRPGKRRREKN
jgi:hypothetical protein